MANCIFAYILTYRYKFTAYSLMFNKTVMSVICMCVDYEKRLGMPAGTINKVVVKSAQNGSWAQMERGEISIEEFGVKFSDECSAEVIVDMFFTSLSFVHFI